MSTLLEFLGQAFTMPTAVFSVLLILVGAYWTLALSGLDFLGGFGDAADGLAEGAVEGVAEGLTEGLAEGVLDGADGLLDGADGLLDGADGVLDGADGILDGADAGHFGPTSVVPKTVILSLFVVFGWLFSFFGMKLAPQVTSTAFQGLGLVLLVGTLSVALAVGATLLALRPLSRVLVIPHATSRHELVGRVCTVTTQRVSPNFGQAEVVVDSVPLLVQVRAEEPNALRRGSAGLIFEYDAPREVFLVAPYEGEMKLPV